MREHGAELAFSYQGDALKKRVGPLAEQLGSFAGQLTETGLKSVTMEDEGQVADLNVKPLTATILMGLLKPLLDSVNMVNAPIIAREREIALSEVKHERPSDYQTMIKLTVTTDRRSRSVAGTLFGGNRPRIVEIKGIPIEAELSPNMLYITNEDKPGFIGRLGQVLGDAGINIATFHLGRNEAGGDAIALLQIDQKMSEKVLSAVQSLPAVKQAAALSF